MFFPSLLLLFVTVFSQSTFEGVIFEELNKCRQNPTVFIEKKGYVLSCNYDGAPLEPFKLIPQLTSLSSFQASTLASNECVEISHDTCSKYCSVFSSCSFYDRVTYFMGNVSYSNPQEVLVKGPKNPLKIVELFLSHEGHCKHILSKDLNAIGATHVKKDKSVSVVTMAYVH